MTDPLAALTEADKARLRSIAGRYGCVLSADRSVCDTHYSEGLADWGCCYGALLSAMADLARKAADHDELVEAANALRVKVADLARKAASWDALKHADHEHDWADAASWQAQLDMVCSICGAWSSRDAIAAALEQGE